MVQQPKSNATGPVRFLWPAFCPELSGYCLFGNVATEFTKAVSKTVSKTAEGNLNVLFVCTNGK